MNLQMMMMYIDDVCHMEARRCKDCPRGRSPPQPKGKKQKPSTRNRLTPLLLPTSAETLRFPISDATPLAIEFLVSWFLALPKKTYDF